MMIWKENQLEVEDYLALRQAVKWRKLTREQAAKALANSLYVLSAYNEDGDIIGMGRLVGDGAVICYIQDLVIHPFEQSSGLGSVLVERLTEYVKYIGIPGTTIMFDLMCAKGREEFYIKNGFMARPTHSLGPGMIQYLDI